MKSWYLFAGVPACGVGWAVSPRGHSFWLVDFILLSDPVQLIFPRLGSSVPETAPSLWLHLKPAPTFANRSHIKIPRLPCLKVPSVSSWTEASNWVTLLQNSQWLPGSSPSSEYGL